MIDWLMLYDKKNEQKYTFSVCCYPEHICGLLLRYCGLSLMCTDNSELSTTFSPNYSWMPHASSIPQLSELGNWFSIYKSKGISHPIYQSSPGMFWLEWSYHSCNLPSKPKWTQSWIDPVLPSWRLSIVIAEIKAWLSEGLLFCPWLSVPLWQSTNSIFHHSSCRGEDGFDAQRQVLICPFPKDKRNGLATTVFNYFYLPQSSVWAPRGASWTLWTHMKPPGFSKFRDRWQDLRP